MTSEEKENITKEITRLGQQLSDKCWGFDENHLVSKGVQAGVILTKAIIRDWDNA